MSDKHAKHYSDSGFWDKATNYAKAAGETVLGKALQLYYAAESPNTPVWAKATIYSALGYFIFPVDAVPDLLPVVGYTDDLGVLTAAVTAVAMHIDEDVKQKAKRKLRDWFG